MQISLTAVGRLKAGPERELCARYLVRAAALARSLGIAGVDLREFDEGRGRRAADRRIEEAKALRAAVPAGARLVLLDEHGKAISSEAFAAEIGRSRDSGIPALVLAIGGPDGHDPALLAQAPLVVAFGAMTWPHQLVRIMAAEQIYRALTILAGHPYHRGAVQT
jgi:23S rRNA (pseudouridine1915-N3)-methyltransferase